MKERRVAVTGLGVVTPLGSSVEKFWKNLCDGVCGIATVKGLDIPVEAKVAAQVKDFDPVEQGLNKNDIRRSDIFCQFALAASIQAMKQSGLVSGENIDPERFGVYIGSGIGGIDTFIQQTKVMLEEGSERVSPLFIPMMIANIAGGNTAIKFNAQGPALANVAACATSTNSVGEAFRAIKHGYADAIITGGTETCVNPLAMGSFTNCKALSMSDDPLMASLPFDSRRGGFVIGEGAGILVLEEYEHAVARGAEIIAEVTGYGNTCDAYHFTAPRPDGIPASRAIAMALEESGYDGEDLYINAHGTGTHLNDKTETQAIKLALGEELARKASISSSKSMTGHMLGATGAIEIIASVLALRDGIIPPTIGLTEPDPECDLDYTPLKARKRDIKVAISNSLGFGGHNACVALRKA